MLRNVSTYKVQTELCQHVFDSIRLNLHAMLRDPGPLEMSTMGFCYMANSYITLTVSTGVHFVIGVCERKLSMPSLKRTLDKQINTIAEGEGRKVGGRERKRMIEDLIKEMLPHAPIVESRIPCHFERETGLLLIGVASKIMAERVLSFLREDMGTLPALPLAYNEPVNNMTGELAGDNLMVSYGFGTTDRCTLEDPLTKAKARITKQDLDAEEVKEHLRNGKRVVKLGLQTDRCSFELDADLTIHGLKLFDMEEDDRQSELAVTEDVYPGAAMAIITVAEVHRVLRSLKDWFGSPLTEASA